MTPEMKVHAWLKKELLRRYPDCYIYKPRAGSYGKKGVPDFICCIDGKFVGIEVKASIKNKPTRSQLEELKKINIAGGIAFVLYGKDTKTLNLIGDA